MELTNSLRSNFLAVQEDYAAPLENGTELNGHAQDCRPAAASWTAEVGDALYVPRIDWGSAVLQEDRDQYEITLKLFFLPTAPACERAKYANEALRLVMKELGVSDVDLLIVSFPGM